MAGHRPVVGFGGPFGDHHHVRDLAASFDAALGAALGSPGAQTAVQLAAQLAAALHEQRLVDRLVGHPHLRPVRELEAKHRRDLLG